MTGQQGNPASVLGQAKELLENEHTLAVATSQPDGSPWIANLYFALVPPSASESRVRLCVLTSPESQHARHWEATGQVALAVYAHPDFPRQEVKGLQMKGHCLPAKDAPDAQAAIEAYRTRFPDAPEVEAGQSYYLIEVSWLKWLDRSTGESGTWPA